jgi:hypothetical protein
VPSVISNTLFQKALPVAAALLFGCLTGCSSDQGNLQMVSLDQQRDFSQSFSRAYIRHDPTGDSDIVLVRDETDIRNDDPNKPLTPDAHVMPRQLVHIRVYWRALSGKADHPASTNASLRWCLLGDGTGDANSLEYGGSGLVLISDSGNWATVTIRRAWMKPIAQRGNMIDPIGPSMLQGKIHAVNDPQHVKALLAQIKLAANPGQQTQTAIQATSDQPQHLTVNP